MPPYRLIWFQHLHKAAGTYIVRKAISNGEKPYPLNKNGNPHDENGAIPLWGLSDSELSNFVDECERLGITFVATEWGGPELLQAIQGSQSMLDNLSEKSDRSVYFKFQL